MPRLARDLDLSTLKLVSESRVMWVTFLFFRSRLRPNVRDRQTDRRQTASSLNAPSAGA